MFSDFPNLPGHDFLELIENYLENDADFQSIPDGVWYPPDRVGEARQPTFKSCCLAKFALHWFHFVTSKVNQIAHNLRRQHGKILADTIHKVELRSIDMKLSMHFIVAGLFSAVIYSSGSFAQDTPDPSQVYIQRLTYAGAGCAAGTVAHNVASDAKAFTLLFDDFIAEAGPTVPSGKNKSACRVTVDLRFPNGWSYSVFTVDYRGFMSLDPNVSATQKSSYYFQAAPGAAKTFSSTYWGPVDQDYQLRDSIVVSDLNWSPCGRTRAMNIDTEISINNALAPQSTGLITIDSIDGQLKQIYGIVWQRCS